MTGLDLGFILLSYLLGAIPFGYLIAKYIYGLDIRELGSKSTGATNVYRCVSKKAGVLVFILDFLKGYLPLIIYLQLNTNSKLITLNYTYIALIIAFMAMLGHSKSIFLNWSGGKSAATGLGTIFALDYRVGFLSFIFWFTIVIIFRIVSLASLLTSFLTIILMYLFKNPLPFTLYCLLGFIFVSFRHKDNIIRIIHNKEAKI